MRQLVVVSLFGLASVARADVATCQQASQNDLKACYQLVTTARDAVNGSDAIYSNSVNADTGARALGETMRNAGISGVETWSSAKTKCDKLKEDADSKCQTSDASAIKLKSDKQFEEYAAYINEGLTKSQQAVAAGNTTAGEVYDQATNEQARTVASRNSDVDPQYQQYVQKTGDYTLVGRDAQGKPITENPYVLQGNIENMKKQIKICNPAVAEVCVYQNDYN